MGGGLHLGTFGYRTARDFGFNSMVGKYAGGIQLGACGASVTQAGLWKMLCSHYR